MEQETTGTPASSEGSTETSQSTQQQTSSSQQQQTQQQTSEPWYSSLPDDLKSNPNITKFQTVAELAKGYNNASSMIGRDKIPMPQTDEELHEVQVRLGKPTAPQEYKIGPELGASWQIEDLQESPEEGIPLDKWKECYKKRVHEFGLTQKQAAHVYEVIAREQTLESKKQRASIEAEMASCVQELRKEWGEQHEVNLIVAGKAAHRLFGPKTMDKIEKAGLGRDPDFLKGLHKIGNRSLEELGIDKRGSALRTPSDLDGEIASLMGHPAYLDKKHSEHQIVKDKVTALMKRRYPD